MNKKEVRTMALRDLKIDPNPTIPLWWAIVLLLGFLAQIVNSIGNFLPLTSTQTGIIYLVAFILTAGATFLTTLEAGPTASNMKSCR
jgi:uncharacterized membrane-anchored protein